jgi:cationic amino acid transporter 14
MIYEYLQFSDLFFRTLSTISNKTNTPAFATVVFGTFAAFAALLISLDVLVEMMSIGEYDLFSIELRY